MRVAIDGVAAVTGGGITYLRSFLPALAQIDEDTNEYLVFLRDRQDLGIDLPDRFRVHRVSLPANGYLFWRSVWQQGVLPSALLKYEVDVLYSPNDLTAFLSPCAVLLAVRNSWPHTNLAPEKTLVASCRRVLLRELTKLSCRKASRILFVSRSSSIELGSKLRVPLPKREVVYHGLDPAFTERRKASAPFPSEISLLRPYVLCVSALYPHKNVETLIEAFGMYVVATADKKTKLVLVGRSVDESYTSDLHRQVCGLNLKGRVEFVGEVPYAEMPEWYCAARLFVLPSLLETFGHPLVEAMASGVPVLASDLPACREVCQEAAVFFGARDSSDLADRISRMLTHKGLRGRLIRNGILRAEDFSWEATAWKTLKLFKEISSSH